MSDEPRARFEALFAGHFDAVLRFLLARAEPEAAKDVAAETFLAAWRGLDDLPTQPRAWLLVVARRKLADHYRAAGRRERLGTAVTALSDWVEPDPADAVTEQARVTAAFTQLTSADQELLRLLAWDGLTRAETAAVLGCSPALLNVRLHRARKRLRRALDDADNSAADSDDRVLDIFTEPTAPLLTAEENA